MTTEENNYQVLITTSGVGSRLGDSTKYTNKSLIRVGDKPALSYIIESYPQDVEFVVTLGYFGDHIRQFLKIAYPNHRFKFVNVDNYNGPGSSLANSILHTRQDIIGPFVFHACDTIVTGKIPPPTQNWLGGSIKKKDNNHYVSFDFNNKVSCLRDKGDIGGDFNYIGLAGIKDHEMFFEQLFLSYNQNSHKSQLSDVDSIKRMIDNVDFEVHSFEWLDIGNLESLHDARERLGGSLHVLDKDTESIYLIDGHIIKFFSDNIVCQNRIKRAQLLGELVPNMIDQSNNFYKYPFVDGEVLANCVNEEIFQRFLEWSSDNLWIQKDPIGDFKQVCYDFYFEKTKKRLESFLNQSGIKDESIVINGEKVPPALEMLEGLSVDWLCNVNPTQFHGDFILDNTIYTEDKSFKLVDWRQDFGGQLEVGDMYYDLAKLNHNLVFNHDIVGNNLFTIDNSGEVKCDILCSHQLVRCQEVLFKFITSKGFDLRKVRTLSSIIWLNMSPLHHYPLNKFLYYFGRYNLHKQVKHES